MTYTLLFVAALLAEMASSIPMGSMPLALFGEGASESQISIVMGSGMFAGLLVSIPVGILVDRVSRILVMKVSLVVCALALVVMGLLHGVLAAYLEMAMRALGVIAFMTAQFAYVSAMFSGEKSERSLFHGHRRQYRFCYRPGFWCLALAEWHSV